MNDFLQRLYITDAEQVYVLDLKYLDFEYIFLEFLETYIKENMLKKY